MQLTPDRIRELVGQPGNPAIDIKPLQSDEVLDKIRDRLRLRMQGPHAEHYSPIAAKLEKFAATVYVETADGVKQATVDLVEIAKQLKEVDDLVGEQWEALDLELFGWRTAPQPLLEPKRALRQILDEYSPQPLPAGLVRTMIGPDYSAAVLEMSDPANVQRPRATTSPPLRSRSVSLGTAAPTSATGLRGAAPGWNAVTPKSGYSTSMFVRNASTNTWSNPGSFGASGLVLLVNATRPALRAISMRRASNHLMCALCRSSACDTNTTTRCHATSVLLSCPCRLPEYPLCSFACRARLHDG